MLQNHDTDDAVHRTAAHGYIFEITPDIEVGVVPGRVSVPSIEGEIAPAREILSAPCFTGTRVQYDLSIAGLRRRRCDFRFDCGSKGIQPRKHEARERAGDLNSDEREFYEASLALRQREQAEREAARQKELDDALQLQEQTEARRKAEAERARDAERAALRLKRRNRIISTIGVVALVLGIAALIFGVQSSVQQRLSRSRELAAIAINQISVDPERAVLIALEANRTSITFESQDALRQAVLGANLRFTLRSHDEGPLYGYTTFSPDGQ